MNINNLNKLIEVLLNSEIDFVIVGGFAAVIHGASLVTKDLDICMTMKDSDLIKLRECLRPYHPWHRMHIQNKLSFLNYPESFTDLKNMYLKTDLGIVDILGEIDGVGNFDHVSKNADKITLLGKTCKVISLKELILAKKAMGRDKDKLALIELEEIQKRKTISQD